MKQAIFTVLLTLFFIISISAQTKPSKTPVKSTPQKPKEITFQKAVTPDGKTVILKSNGTWEFAPVEVSEKTKAKPCDLTLKDAPVIRTFKLDMARYDFLYAFGTDGNEKTNPFYLALWKTKPNGVLHYTFYDSDLKELPVFAGIQVLELEFFEQRLHSITIKYSESTAKFTREQFKLKLIESFNLPVEAWSSNPDSEYFRGYENLECKEFQIQVTSGNEFTLTNLLTLQKIRESEKNKRDIFKP